MVSGATVTSVGYQSRCRAPWTRPACERRPASVARYVDHVMGLPVSLALRGRHADDDRGRARVAGA